MFFLYINTGHGKSEVAVPMDTVRCPSCIQRHLEESGTFPAVLIGIRPDLEKSIPCPRCQEIAERNKDHEVFFVRADLLPFYRDGVSGEQRRAFETLATRYGLSEGCRCPNCRTVLIPIHHRQMGTRSTA